MKLSEAGIFFLDPKLCLIGLFCLKLYCWAFIFNAGKTVMLHLFEEPVQ